MLSLWEGHHLHESRIGQVVFITTVTILFPFHANILSNTGLRDISFFANQVTVIVVAKISYQVYSLMQK